MLPEKNVQNKIISIGSLRGLHMIRGFFVLWNGMSIMSPVLLARLKGAKPVEPRTVPRKKTGFCVAAFLLALSFPAHATDYINNDLSSPVVDVNNYVNVTVTNNRTLSSGSLVGGYLYMPGNITGTVDITNNGSITSTHSNYGVFYLPPDFDTKLSKNGN